MDNWEFYGSSDSGKAYILRTSWPRFVVELELGSDGSWRGSELWAIDTVSADDVERPMREMRIRYRGGARISIIGVWRLRAAT